MRIHRLIRILMRIDRDGKVKARDMAQALKKLSSAFFIPFSSYLGDKT